MTKHMKTLIKFATASLLMILSFGCNNDNNNDAGIEGEKSIIGSWKLVEAYISSGGPQYWVTIENGEVYNFFSNGIFSSNRYSECTSGNFSTEFNKLILNYDCNGFTTGFENSEGAITYEITLESNYFLLTPTSVTCIEGCSYKYKKISDEE
jgi:hypothetical protein